MSATRAAVAVIRACFQWRGLTGGDEGFDNVLSLALAFSLMGNPAPGPTLPIRTFSSSVVLPAAVSDMGC